MPDQTQDNSKVEPSKAPLSDHAEDVLAEAVGHELHLADDAQTAAQKTVKQVLAELVGDRDELAITLEYGTGESGVDQASWGIEVTSLQRAYMRVQSHETIDKFSKQISDEVKIAQQRASTDWADRTVELRSLIRLFDQARINRQEIDDYRHRIFGQNTYLGYIESVMELKDKGKLLDAVSNLKQVSEQLAIDYEQLVDPAKVDNNALAGAIIEAEGDIDKLSVELERDYPSALFRRSVDVAAEFLSVVNVEFLTEYKMWAHSLDLNIREILATEKSVSNGQISEKAHKQLKEMLNSGEDKVLAIIKAIL